MSATVETAGAEDEPAVRRLLREQALGGDIQLTLEREPDHRLAAAEEGVPQRTVVIKDGDRVVGLGSRAVMDVFVNGEPRRVGYLGQLRLERGNRARRHLIASAYATLRERGPGEEPFDLTSIVADNAPARRLLEGGVRGLPAYRPLEDFRTFLLATRSAARPAAPAGVRLDIATADLAPEIAACLARFGRRHQLARRWTALFRRDLRPEHVHVAWRGPDVVGCLAVWDQRGFKQVVVRGYAPGLRRVRPLLNLVAPLLRMPRLPAPGETVPLVFLSHLAVDDDDPAVFAALLGAALGAASVPLAAIGLAARHPLAGVVRRAGRVREYASVLYAVSDDAGADAVRALDGRIAHPEVALL